MPVTTQFDSPQLPWQHLCPVQNTRAQHRPRYGTHHQRCTAQPIVTHELIPAPKAFTPTTHYIYIYIDDHWLLLAKCRPNPKLINGIDCSFILTNHCLSYSTHFNVLMTKKITSYPYSITIGEVEFTGALLYVCIWYIFVWLSNGKIICSQFYICALISLVHTINNSGLIWKKGWLYHGKQIFLFHDGPKKEQLLLQNNYNLSIYVP